MTLVSRLPEIARALKVDVPDALDEAADLAVVTAARARIHNVTTELARSVHVEKSDEGVSIVADARDEQGTPYGRFVEFGTHHASPHPFLVPALMGAKRELVDAVSAGIKEACK